LTTHVYAMRAKPHITNTRMITLNNVSGNGFFKNNTYYFSFKSVESNNRVR